MFLRFWLFIAGGLLILCIWFFNRWQLKKQLRLMQDVFGAKESSSLKPSKFAEQENEIFPSELDTPEEDSFFEDSDLTETSVSELLDTEAALLEPEDDYPYEIDLPELWVDKVLDATVHIHCIESVEVKTLRKYIEKFNSSFEDKCIWIAYDSTEKAWSLLEEQPTNSVNHIIAAMQLVQRAGCQSAESIQAFLDYCHEIATKFRGMLKTPSLQSLVEHTKKLDEFAMVVDLQLTLSVTGLSEATMEQVLSETEAIEGEQARFVLWGDGMSCYSVMSLQTNLGNTVLQFSLDIPRVKNPEEAYRQMMLKLRDLQGLGAVLVDQNNEALDDEFLIGVESRLADITSAMKKNEIIPGSLRALRLFS